MVGGSGEGGGKAGKGEGERASLCALSVRVFDSASRPNVAPNRGSSQWSS